MASSDLNELFGAALEFAKTMQVEVGEFLPFGVSMNTSGKIEMVAADMGVEQPASKDVIALLQSSFRQLASQNIIRAAGVCFDVRVVPPGYESKSDAICVRLAHVSGEAIEVYELYVANQSGTYAYGEVFASDASEFTFDKHH